jgi:hypothetical protein
MTDESVERSILHVLDKHEESFLIKIGKIILDDIAGFTNGHDSDLLLYLL